MAKPVVFPFSKIWPAAMSAELGSLGSGGRYKPVWILYIELETWLFGDRPRLYHGLRILYFALFFGTLCRIAAHCIGLVPALVFVTGITGLRFWSNLWTLSLGPLEQLAAAGVALLMIAYDTIVPRYVSGADIPAWALPTASLGTAIAAGSKENFVFLLAIFGAVAITLALTRRLRIASAILALPPLVVPALVLYALASAAGNSQDYYGVDNSVAHRLAALLDLRQVLDRPFFVPFVLAALLLAVTTCLARLSPIPAATTTASPSDPCIHRLYQLPGRVYNVGAFFLQWTATIGDPIRLPNSAVSTFHCSRVRGFRPIYLAGEQRMGMALRPGRIHRADRHLSCLFSCSVLSTQRRQCSGCTNHGVPPRLQRHEDDNIDAFGLADRPGAELALGF